MKVATPVGTLVGQLLFGWLADVVGRKRMCESRYFTLLLFDLGRSPTIISDGVELMIIIIATFGQALSGQAPAIHIIGVLVVWRFLVSLDLSNLLSNFTLNLNYRSDGGRHRR